MTDAPTITTAAMKPAPHPAKFSAPIMDVIADILANHLPHGSTILDPFGGVGGIHDLSENYDTFAVEIEKEWADQAKERGATWCGDFLEFTPDAYWPRVFDAIVTSPAYGNRMADNHTPGPNDTSSRITYRHKLGRPLTTGNAGGYQWGDKYRMFHRAAWRKAVDLLAPDGLFVLNVSDHIRGGEVVPVSDWHRDRLIALGLTVIEDHRVETQRMGFGKNREARVDHERVIVLRKST